MTSEDAVEHPVVTLRNVGVRYGGRAALREISFAVLPSSICVVVGPNGAGKTTLVRLLAGALTPSSGTIAWPRIGARAPRAGGRARIALVAQSVALYPFLTLYENCLASGRMEGLRGAVLVARARTVIEQTRCAAVRDQLAGRLSGGFQRRAAIAAALMGDAPLVVLDEPTTGLDAEATEAIVAVVRALKDAGKAVVITTHDFAFSDATADVALFLRAGALAAAGTPQQLRATLFGARKYVDFSLTDDPGPRQAAILGTMAAERLAARRYGLFGEPDEHGGLAVLQGLHAAGIAVRELRVREPGIAMLFERYCRKGASP